MSSDALRDGADVYDIVGRSALVVGASPGGLGARAAAVLGSRGARLLLADHPSQADELAEFGRELTEAGIGVTTAVCDVTDEHAVTALVKTVRERLGTLDIAVNAAGVMLRKPVEETTLAEWNAVLSVNLTGTWLIDRACAEIMREAQGGRIIYFSTVYADRVGPIPEAAYYASKAGVANLTRSMASELGRDNIHVNCLALGVFYPTRMTAPLEGRPDQLEWMKERTLLKRLGNPDTDLEGPLVLLASAASGYMTGQVVYVDGGWSAW